MNVLAIIPARYGSTRFPGKPLANQTGKYLVQHVYERAAAAKAVQRCIVATDDARIAEAVRSFGGQVVLTRPDHVSGTDRVAEVVAGLPGGANDIILNVQGDEPEIEPEYLDRLVSRLEASRDCQMATLACPFSADADPSDPNCVKVVCDRAGRALYFSRSLIPYPRQVPGLAQPLLHLGVYGYRRRFLLEFASWPAGVLEQTEKLEQLRALENGFAIAVELVPRAFVGIDTPQDYEQFVKRWQAQHGRAVSV